MMAKFKSKFDFERAAMLLNIMKQVADIGPMWSTISSEAGDELKSMNDDLVDERKARAERDRNVHPGQPADSGIPQPPKQQRIFPEGSGVQEEHDPPIVQRRVQP